MESNNQPVDEGLPADPESWTDEQWLAWLRATDADAATDSVDEHRTLTERAANSAIGVVLGQAMLGMARAIYGRPDEDIVIVADGEGPSREDEPFSVHLDFEHPGHGSVSFSASDADPDPGFA